MPRIFISYRRAVVPELAGRLYDRLAAVFGSQNVFLDAEAIPPGVTFESYILDRIRSSDALVVLLAEGTLDRTSDPQDWVRREIATALNTPGVRVVPVRVNDFQMPTADRLPTDIRAIAALQAIHLMTGDLFRASSDQIVDYLRRAYPQPLYRRRSVIGAALAVVLLVVLVVVVAALLTPRGEGGNQSPPLPSLTPGPFTPTMTRPVWAMTVTPAATPDPIARQAQIVTAVAAVTPPASALYGPVEGVFELVGTGDSQIFSGDEPNASVGQMLRNFDLRVTFDLPTVPGEGWGNIISFRKDALGEFSGFQIALGSDNTWKFTRLVPGVTQGMQVTFYQTLQTGVLGGVDLAATAARVRLIVFENWAYLFVNDTFVGTLFLEGSPPSGEIRIGPTINVTHGFPSDEPIDFRFHDFVIWPLDGCFGNAPAALRLYAEPDPGSLLVDEVDAFSGPVLARSTGSDGANWVQMPGKFALVWVQESALRLAGACTSLPPGT